MYCKKCGAQLIESAKFCNVCGAKVLKENPAESQERLEMKNLLQRAMSGSSEAAEELYKMTYAQGYSVALQIVKNEQDASDLLQDAYISAFQNLSQVTKPESFRSWFNCIVANKCRDWIKKKKPELFTDMGHEDDDVAFEDTLEDENLEFSPEEYVDYKETKRLINDILQNLPEDQRLCILLHYYEQLPVQDIATALNCSTGTVKSRLNYGRKKIKTEVEDLKKKGVHLYGIAPIPFLVWMLRQSAKQVSVPEAGAQAAFLGQTQAAVAGQVLADTTARVVKATTEEGAKEATKEVATNVAKEGAKQAGASAVKKSVAKRVVAGIVGATVIGGAGVATPKVIDYVQQQQQVHQTVGADKEAEQQKEVKPKEEKSKVDAFANLHVTFEGISPCGRAQMSVAEDTDFTGNDFWLDQEENLRDGQTIVARLTEDGMEKYLALYGKKPEKEQQEYQVTLSKRYVASIADIGQSSLEDMKKQAEDTHTSIRAKWKQPESFQKIAYIGNYLLESKGNAECHNKIYLVYKIETQNVAENTETKEKYNKVNSHYWYLCYSDIYVNENKVVQNSLVDKYEVAEGEVYIDSEIKTGETVIAPFASRYPTYNWQYTGYPTKEELYRVVVEANAEKYKVEEDLIDIVE